MFEVRRARPEDLENLRAFFAVVASRMASRRGGEDLLRFSESQVKTDHGDHFRTENAVVGIIEGSIVAYASLRTIERDPHQRAQLEVFYLTAPGADMSDIIRDVISAGEAAAEDAGAGALDVISLPGDQILKSALEERGYRARLLVMHRPL